MNRRAPLLAPAAAFLLGAALSLAGVGWSGWGALALPLVALEPIAPAAFAAAGWWSADRARAAPRLPPAGQVELAGRIVNVPAAAGERLRFTLRDRTLGLLDVMAPPAEWPLAAGDEVRLLARLRRPPGPRNPGGADTADRLEAVGIALQADGLLPPVRTAPPSPLAWLERGRERFAEAASVLPPREAGLVRAIGTGDRAALDAATNESFVRSGLAHILAVSGLHLVVVAAGLEWLLRGLWLRIEPLASRLDARQGAAALTLPLMVAYTFATGAGFPVVRAALAAGLIGLGVLLDREGNSANTLGLAALAVLAVEPGALLDPSFQLSLTSVAGLVALASPLRRALPFQRPRAGTWRARLIEPLLSGLCATLAASLATAPILALNFRRLPALGVVANLAGVPIGTALTALTAAAAAVAAASPTLAVPLVWLCRPLATALLLVSDAAAAPSFAVLGVASPGPLLAALACALALSLARLQGGWRWLAALAFLGCLTLPGPLRAAAARARGQLDVLFLSVGQGDATLLRLPDGSAVLIDGGGTFPGGPDPGARDVLPLLLDLGVRRLAAVIVSHPHPDHVLGLASVARGLPIDRVVLGGSAAPDSVREALATLPPSERLRRGDGWTLAGVRFEVLSDGDLPLTENDASLVLRVDYGATSLLFPGDLAGAGEAALLAGGAERLRVDLVKVAHHGSRTSSGAAFVAATRPRWAVAELGSGNRFGFPHDEAVAAWRSVGATFLRTDAGAIRFVSDGRALRQVEAATALDPLEAP